MDNIPCNLVGAAADAQTGAWGDLGRSLRRSERVDDGLRLWFDRGAEDRLRDIAVKEKDCCPFLDLAVTADGDDVRLDVTTELADARPVIDGLAELVGAVDR